MLCAARDLMKRQECSRWSGAAASHSKRNHKGTALSFEKQEKLKPRQGKAGLKVSLRGALVSGIRVDVP